MKYKWPLNTSNFPLLDRIKICLFFLNPFNFWTQNVKVQEFERQMAEFTGFKFAIFTSSGSTANTILAMYLKDKLSKYQSESERNIVVLPSTTWQTSCSPWIREGFKPHFIDVSLDNFGMDLNKLDAFLSENHEKVAAVFPTALLGFNLDYNRLKVMEGKYPYVSFYIDQCENNFGKAIIDTPDLFSNFTSTTSTYMGHEIQSVEGGFIFTNKVEEYEQFLMYRNHGMTRGLDNSTFRTNKDDTGINNYKNTSVDARFDFYLLGNNFRNSDIHAYIGLLDFKRKEKYIARRHYLYQIFKDNINQRRYLLPKENNSIPFCLPIICQGAFPEERLMLIKAYCADRLIETRPILSGFLGYQTAYKGMMEKESFTNSILLNNNGIYVGLNHKITEKQIVDLTTFLNII